MLSRLTRFIKNEVVLSVAVVLALISSVIIRPDAQYAGYIDYRTIALLFCLMTIMQGFTSTGVFRMLAEKLLGHVVTFRQLMIVLVMLCFVCSMWITNDVSLITFVPFTILVLKMAHLEHEMIPVIVMQTVAANLGSMCTPIGNPQNLYLYSVSGMSVMDFIRTMGPLSLISLIMILVVCVLHKNYKVNVDVGYNSKSGSMAYESSNITEYYNEVLENKNENIEKAKEVSATLRHRLYENVILVVLFALSLLTVARVLPYQALFIIIICGCLLLHLVFKEKILFLSIDYSLLFTFAAFFIFIGNMGRIDVVKNAIDMMLSGREIIVSFLCSQVISNVPAAILLSGFTSEYRALMIGVNIGGLGTLIASLASLISYKFYAHEIRNGMENNDKQDNKAVNTTGRYMLYFTIVNVGMAVILLVAAMLM